jgi:mRNA interferase MazF
MTNRYVPDEGDIVWLSFNPQSGKEQAGHRPALVLTPKSYNQVTGLMVCAPVTTKIKDYPFEVLVELDGTMSAVLSDHLKSLDWQARDAEFKSRVEAEILLEVRSKLKPLLGIG